jgi:hypothetical protein
VPFELVPPGTHIDFIGKRRITAVISTLLLLAGVVATPFGNHAPSWRILWIRFAASRNPILGLRS